MSNEKISSSASETNPNADSWSSLEDYNVSDSELDNRVEDVDKAYEMAKAEDKHRTTAAAGRVALNLLRAAELEDVSQKSIVDNDRYLNGTLTGEYIKEKQSETAVDGDGNVVERHGRAERSYGARQMDEAIKLIDRDLHNKQDIKGVISREESYAEQSSSRKGDAYDILYGKDKRN